MEFASSQEQIKELIREQVLAQTKQDIFDLEKAKVLANRAEEKAKQMGVPIVFSAVDSGGNLLLVHRMTGSLLGSLDVSINKAFSANAFKMPTHQIGELCQPGKSLYGIQYTNGGRVVAFGGGLPCCYNGEVMGAIGVSGGTAQQDLEIATYVLEQN